MGEDQLTIEKIPQQPPAPAQDLVKNAWDAVERLEKENAELKNLLAQQALMKAEQILGGKADAGRKEETDEDREVKAARALLAGTGYESDLFPEK